MKQRLSIATGGTGGVFYPYGGGIAKVISENLPGVEATAEVTAASVDNLKFLKQGTSDLAFTMADTAQDAMVGKEGFEGIGAVPVRTLAVLYSSYVHLVALESSGISRVADLRGRTVSTGAAGSGTTVLANRILQAAGLDPQRDIRAQSLGVAQSVDALKDGKIDAFFWNAGLPTASILDLVNTSGIHARFISTEEIVPRLRTRPTGSELYYTAVIPKGTYKTNPDVPVVAVANLLVVVRIDAGDARPRHHAAALRQEERPRGHPSAGPRAGHRDGAEGIADSVSSGRHPLLPRTTGVDASNGERPRARAATSSPLAFPSTRCIWVIGIVDPQVYRVSFLLIALAATFLVYPFPSGARSGVDRQPRRRPVHRAGRRGAGVADRGLRCLRPPRGHAHDARPGARRDHHAARPRGDATDDRVDSAGNRRAVSRLRATSAALLDQVGLSLIAHRGYSVPRILGTLYMTLEGIFGVPLDVTATYIVLFTIYGAVLEHSGAGKFFIDWAAAAVGRSRSGSGAGRTVTVAGYLLGAVSGSGVANTVMLGAVAWPMMRRAGYPPDTGGAILAASGIGAILAPPAMGAAAFLIAEYLKITYLQVIAMAAVPAAPLLPVRVPDGRSGLATACRCSEVDVELPTSARPLPAAGGITSARCWRSWCS